MRINGPAAQRGLAPQEYVNVVLIVADSVRKLFPLVPPAITVESAVFS
jgi:hypothetical protein